MPRSDYKLIIKKREQLTPPGCNVIEVARSGDRSWRCLGGWVRKIEAGKPRVPPIEGVGLFSGEQPCGSFYKQPSGGNPCRDIPAMAGARQLVGLGRPA